MIAKALRHIVDELNDYLDNLLNVQNQIYTAEITNIQKSGDGNAGNPGIKVALINVEEDKVYKNHLLPLEGRPAQAIDPIHPLGGIMAMRLNLYVLVAFNAQNNNDSQGYLDTLTVMTHVLRYFHSNPYQKVLVQSNPDQYIGLEIEYHNISLEDSNNMWSNLGGEQKPYAMYKIKMLEIRADDPTELAATLQHEPIISSPDLGPDGETLFNPDGSPQGDTNEIKQQ